MSSIRLALPPSGSLTPISGVDEPKDPSMLHAHAGRNRHAGGARSHGVGRVTAISTLVLGLAAVLGAAVTALAGWGTAAPRMEVQAQAAFDRFATVPVAARGPISAALGRHDTRYQVIGLQARNQAQHLTARFSAAGATMAAGRTRARLALTGYGRPGALRRVVAAQPTVRANRVDYAHPGVEEWWANGPLGLEQGFDVRARPSAGRGPLTLTLGVAGSLHARESRAAVALGHTLRYGGLTATDAHGVTLPATLRVEHGRIVIGVDDRDAAYPIRIDPFVSAAQLTASDGSDSDLLGISVAISGDTIAAMGTQPASVQKTKPSAIYVFVKPASGWANATQTAKLTPSDGDNNSAPSTVAISGDTIVAGEDNRTVGTTVRAGAALVFVKPARGWHDAHETAVLTASDGAKYDGLGGSVAVSGDTVVTTSADHDNLKGTAYVYVKPPGGWTDATQTAELTASDGAPADDLDEVAISGGTIVAGSSQHAVGGRAAQGAAYVFERPAAGWKNATQTAELTASDGAVSDHLADSVAVSGDTVVAGAVAGGGPNLDDHGAVYVFVKPAAGWKDATQTAKLTDSDGALFVHGVAIAGDRIIAGAFQLGAPDTPVQGAADVFVKPPGGWHDATQTEKLTNPDTGTDTGYFGYSVALSGNLAVVGAPTQTVGQTTAQGAIHVLGPPPTITIGTPADGATFTQGELIGASFSCTAPVGATITTCAGPIANGAAIDTSAPGPHTFTVNTLDTDGVAATRTVSYTVMAARGSAGPTSHPPSITAVRQSSPVWRPGRKLALIASAHKPPVGTTFSFTLDQAATVTLRFTRHAPGRSRGGRCTKPAANNKRAPRCTRSLAAGALRITGHSGRNRVHFEGRISRSHQLTPGRYTLQITATNVAGQHASGQALRFTIVKPT
jgi:hypothetical protein